MKRHAPIPSLIALSLGSIFSTSGLAQQLMLTDTVEVVGTTPMAGMGVPTTQGLRARTQP